MGMATLFERITTIFTGGAAPANAEVPVVAPQFVDPFDQNTPQQTAPSQPLTKQVMEESLQAITFVKLRNGREVGVQDAKELTDDNRNKNMQDEITRFEKKIGEIEAKQRIPLAELQADITAAAKEKDELVKQQEAASKELDEAAKKLGEAKLAKLTAEGELQKKIDEVNKAREEEYRKQLENYNKLPPEARPQNEPAKPDTITREQVAKNPGKFPELEESFQKSEYAQKSYEEIKKSSDAAESNYKEVTGKLEASDTKLKGLQEEYSGVDNQYRAELIEHGQKMQSFGPGKPDEAAKITEIIDNMQPRIALLDSTKQIEINNMIAAAALDPDGTRTASEFMDQVRERLKDIKGVDPSSLAPQELVKPNDGSRVNGVNITIVEREGKLYAEFVRPVRGSDALDIDSIELKSNTLDMSQFEGMDYVSIKADRLVNEKLLLVNTERVNLRFFGPQPGLGGSGYDPNDWKNPAEAFQVVGASDNRAAARLDTANLLADKYEQLASVREQYGAYKKIAKADEEINRLQQEMLGNQPDRYGQSKGGKDTSQDVASVDHNSIVPPTGIPGGAGSAVART
jgi:hypothetical protein